MGVEKTLLFRQEKTVTGTRRVSDRPRWGGRGVWREGNGSQGSRRRRSSTR